MTKYKFRAKDIKTGDWVEGDLVHATQVIYTKGEKKYRIKPMIVTAGCHGGMVWIYNRYFVDEDSITLINDSI